MQVEANNQLKGVTAEGANVLPARVIEDAFQNQYDKTLNYTDFKGAIQKLDKWYADRGIFGQVRFLTLPNLGHAPICPWRTASSWKHNTDPVAVLQAPFCIHCRITP